MSKSSEKVSAEARQKHEFWFEFLKLNTEYRDTCDKKGKGKLGRLYEDFGDIFSTPFDKWYAERYDALFRPNPEARFLFDHVETEEAFKAYSTPSDGAVVIAVNTMTPLSTLEEEFPKFIRRLAKFAPGRRRDDWSTFDGSRYPLRKGPGARVLKNIRYVYVAWLEEKQKRGGKTPELWSIGQRVLAPNDYERKKLLDATERHYYSVRAQKHLQQAKALILNAANNLFPIDKQVDPADYPSIQRVEAFFAEFEGRR